MFVLDALSIRAMVAQEGRRDFQVSTATAAVTFAVAALVHSTLTCQSIGVMRGHKLRTSSDSAASSGPIGRR